MPASPIRQLLDPPYLWLIRGPQRAAGLAWLLSRSPSVPFFVQKLLTRPLRLVDVRFYRQNAGLAADQPALSHYLRHGDRLGLAPNPFFDPGFYDLQLGRRPAFNRLLHYALLGRHRGLRPSAGFDPAYYLQTYADVVAAGHDPLVHFLRRGRYEGRQPCAEAALWRRRGNSADERIARLDPVSAGLAVAPIGAPPPAVARGPGDPPDPTAQAAAHTPVHTPAQSPAPPTLISTEAAFWSEKPGRSDPPGPGGLVVAVPVHGGHQQTLRCLMSVLRAPTRVAFQLLVIDDASPDPRLRRDLEQLAARGLFRLHRHSRNLGFTATANEAMAHRPDADLVLLNSDTEVYGDWLDRLVAAAARHPGAASLTPLSNNATIASYPHWLQNTPWRTEAGELGVEPGRLDRLAARSNEGRSVAIPTGIGFCLFLRRQAITAIGPLDTKAFGRGYGEEVDWCRRAVRAGWEHRLVSDVYVAHAGGVSFSASSERRNRRAQRRIEGRHPGYRALVQRFIDADPVFPERARLDLERLLPERQTSNLLQIAHGRGGGVERCLAEERLRAEAEGWGVFELRPSHRPGRLSLEHPSVDGTPSLWEIDLVGQLPAVAELLETLRIQKLQLHHWIDCPPETPDLLLALRDQLGLELELWLHDYYPICPRVTLFDPALAEGGSYCGQPLADRQAVCDRCLAADGLADRVGPIGPWRRRSERLLALADRLVAPSQDTAQRYRALWPELEIAVLPHDDPHQLEAAAAAATLAAPDLRSRPSAPCRVLVLGAISASKGFHLLRRLAVANGQASPPTLALALLGAASDEEALGRAGVALLGRYRDSDVQARIEAAAPDLILIPSLWPETHCYTLSHALASGRPVAAFDLGAQAERLRRWRGANPTAVLPLALAEPQRILELIASLRRLGADNCPCPLPPISRG